MKKLFLFVALVVTLSSVQAQSFYHKRMKKVSKRPAIEQCEAMKPKRTMPMKIQQKKLYTRKRNQKFNKHAKR